MTNELKRTYNIPLRREFLKVPKHKRAKKAVKALQQFVKRHMKIDNEKNIKIGKFLNEEIWKHGIKNPPHHVKVNILKDLKENKALVELFGKDLKFEDKKKDKKDKKETLLDKAKEKLGAKESKKPKKADKETKEATPAKTETKEDDVLAELKGEAKEEPKAETVEEKPAEEAKEEPKAEEPKEELKAAKKELPKTQDKPLPTETAEKKVEQQPNAPLKE